LLDTYSSPILKTLRRLSLRVSKTSLFVVSDWSIYSANLSTTVFSAIEMTFIGFSFFNLHSYSTEKTDRSLWFIFFRHPLSCDPRKRCFVLVFKRSLTVVTLPFSVLFPSRAIEMNCLFLEDPKTSLVHSIRPFSTFLRINHLLRHFLRNVFGWDWPHEPKNLHRAVY